MANEKRLIDANEYPCKNCEVSYCYKNCKKFDEWLNKTVDAVEVKHGHWFCLEQEIGLFECSECGHKILRASCNFYPNCGADMRERKDNGEDKG